MIDSVGGKMHNIMFPRSDICFIKTTLPLKPFKNDNFALFLPQKVVGEPSHFFEEYAHITYAFAVHRRTVNHEAVRAYIIKSFVMFSVLIVCYYNNTARFMIWIKITILY